MSYVYFLTDADRDDAIVKIGVSKDIARRIRQLEAQVPFKIRCIEYIDAQTQNDAYQIEHALHRHFEDRRLMREWFDIKHSEIAQASIEVIRELGLGEAWVDDHGGVLPPRVDR